MSCTPRRPAIILTVLTALAGCGGGGGVRPIDLPTPAASACRAAVASEVNSGNVRIGSTSGAAGGTERVTIRAPGGDWGCTATADGTVLDLTRRR